MHRWHKRENYELLFVPLRQRGQSRLWDDLGIAGSHHAICVVGVGLDDPAHLLDALRLVEDDRSHHLFPAFFIRDLRRQKRATELCVVEKSYYKLGWHAARLTAADRS